MTFTVAGGQTAGYTKFGRTTLEPALKDETKILFKLKSYVYLDRPHSINEQNIQPLPPQKKMMAYFS